MSTIQPRRAQVLARYLAARHAIVEGSETS